MIDRLALTVPELEGAAEPLLERLTEMALEYPADPIVPAHHDFRPAQVLLHQGCLGFIDFDGASMAEPALDLGRFRAKLRDIGISSLIYTGQPLSGQPLADNLALLDGLCEDFLAAYLEHGQVSRQRVLMWETCDLVTGMLHAWTKVRLVRVEPAWRCSCTSCASAGWWTPRLSPDLPRIARGAGRRGGPCLSCAAYSRGGCCGLPPTTLVPERI